MRILGVGIATLDIVNLVDHYPQEDEELRAVSQYINRGGNTANTLGVLAQFNHQCTWVGTIGNDSSAQYVLDDFSKNNINYSYCKKLENGTQPTSYITLNRKNGSRTIVHYRDLPELDFEHFAKIPLDNFNWAHFEARAIEETAAMVRMLKKQHPQIKVSIEIEKSRVNLQNILSLADLYFFSKSYALAAGFTDARDFLRYQKSISPNADLVCSWAEQGAFANLQNGELLSSGAFAPAKLVDTLGAGDTFNAALIHSRLTSRSWQDSLTFACQLAGKKCGQLGFENLT